MVKKNTRIRGDKVESADVTKTNQFLKNDGSSWELSENVFENDFAAQMGFTKKCLTRLINEFGESTAKEIAYGSLTEAPVIVAIPDNTTNISSITPHHTNGFGVIEHGVEFDSLLDKFPDMRVQDPTSVGSLSILKDIHPKRILDICAGRGTKTKQLRHLFPTATIGATEPNDIRRAALEDVASSIRATVYSREGNSPSEPFDLVVVDVPCSNSGVFSRRPEAKYRYDSKHINSLIELQREIVMDAFRVLLNKGYLLYATCSIDSAENISQANWISENLPLTKIDEKFTLPSGYPGSDPTCWHDGGYTTLFQKR